MAASCAPTLLHMHLIPDKPGHRASGQQPGVTLGKQPGLSGSRFLTCKRQASLRHCLPITGGLPPSEVGGVGTLHCWRCKC